MEAEWAKLVWMAAASTAAVVAAAYLAPGTDRGVLDAFYRRVRPPGFWSGAAERVGEAAGAPRRRLGRGLYLVSTTALSAYLVLVAGVKLIVPAPGEAGWWGWGLLVAGMASFALWWGPVFGRKGPAVPVEVDEGAGEAG